MAGGRRVHFFEMNSALDKNTHNYINIISFIKRRLSEAEPAAPRHLPSQIALFMGDIFED